VIRSTFCGTVSSDHGENYFAFPRMPLTDCGSDLLYNSDAHGEEDNINLHPESKTGDMDMSHSPSRDSTGPSGYRSHLIKAVIYFVVIGGGVATGIVVATKLGVADKLSSMTYSVEDLDNNSLLKVESPFPLLEATGVDGDTVDLVPLLKGQRCVVAIVSAGCEPCHRFIRFAEREGIGTNDDLRVILLALDPEPFKEETDLTVLKVSMDQLNEHDIYSFPTLIGIGKDGRMKFVASGFNRYITEDFIRDNI